MKDEEKKAVAAGPRNGIDSLGKADELTQTNTALRAACQQNTEWHWGIAK